MSYLNASWVHGPAGAQRVGFDRTEQLGEFHLGAGGQVLIGEHQDQVFMERAANGRPLGVVQTREIHTPHLGAKRATKLVDSHGLPVV